MIQGNAGLDYRTRYYLTAFANDKLMYAAGRYRPSLNELDCIGIVVLDAFDAHYQEWMSSSR